MQAPGISDRVRRQIHLRGLRLSMLLTGFALGGLLDGIVLHQILQWHHLLSAVKAPGLQDLRIQILADGVFHLAMYIALIGAVITALRERRLLANVDVRWLIGICLVGFGCWHVFDAVVDHWIFKIHHIKTDSANPIAWDIGWFVALGVVPMILGQILAHVSLGSSGDGSSGASTALGLLFLGAVGVNSLAAIGSVTEHDGLLIALPGATTADVLKTVARLNASIVWVDRSGAVWRVSRRDDTPMAQTAIEEGGVLVMIGHVGPGGCAI